MNAMDAYFSQIKPPDEDARAAAHTRWNRCAKPLGSLGLLETALEDVAALTGTANIDLSRRSVLVLCSDNGVVAQGVTQSGQEVTAAVAGNLSAGTSSVCRMAQTIHCRVVPVDMGMALFAGSDGVLSRSVGKGTADITQGAAMTRTQAIQAVCIGIELVRQQAEQGVRLIATGEMGIGNTTTSAAVASVLLGKDPEEVTGRGAGLSDEGLRRKLRVIRQAIAVNHPDPENPLEVLQTVGGFDLAGLCGVFLGGAVYRVPIIIDGVISASAALCAARMCPLAKGAMLASHLSTEPAHGLLMNALGKTPVIYAGLHLGEGTGAVALMPLLDMAAAVYQQASSFADLGMEAYTPQGGEQCLP